MEEWQTKVIDEREDLVMKIYKLEHFLDVTDVENWGEPFTLLRKQLEAMYTYCNILDERIKEF